MEVEDEDVRAALKFIRDHARDPIDVADVADAVGISRRTLETRFQKAIGQTPAESLRHARIAIAKKLLIETNDALTSIVYASGFSNRQAFSTLFRKETGVAPSEFRKQYQSGVLVDDPIRQSGD
jgi:LacI family transcriptional regulator